MDISTLKRFKGLPRDRTALDFMGKEELAANLFRITQTEAKIRNERVRGQRALETAAHDVGRTVRSTMIRTRGSHPEHLPIATDIVIVRKSIKAARKEFEKLDSRKGHKRLRD